MAGIILPSTIFQKIINLFESVLISDRLLFMLQLDGFNGFRSEGVESNTPTANEFIEGTKYLERGVMISFGLRGIL